MDVESLPNFTRPARQRWESISGNIRPQLLANVWCGHCRHEVTSRVSVGTEVRGGSVNPGTRISEISASMGDGNRLPRSRSNEKTPS